MSIKWMTTVWDHSRQEGSALLLLLAIADCANEHGEAWPGSMFLAKRIRLSRTYVRKLVLKIVASKELKIVYKGGSGTADANHYKITVKGHPGDTKTQGHPGDTSSVTGGASSGTDHAQILLDPKSINILTNKTTRSTNYPPPPPGAAGVGELEKVGDSFLQALEETTWTWKAIPNIPARSIQNHAHGPDKFIALYLYYLTQSGIKSPMRAALARLGRGEIDPGQIFDQLGELPPASLAILLNWLAEGASDYTTTDLNGAAMLGHAFAELFRQPPSGIQSRPQQERQAEAEQQTIRSVAVHALTDLNLWRLLPPVIATQPEPDESDFDPTEPIVLTGEIDPKAEMWRAALDQLRLEMVPATFDAWLRETELIAVGPDEFVIGVPSPHARDWLANRMTATIERTLARFVGNAWSVKFIVKGK